MNVSINALSTIVTPLDMFFDDTFCARGTGFFIPSEKLSTLSLVYIILPAKIVELGGIYPQLLSNLTVSNLYATQEPTRFNELVFDAG